MPIVYLFGDRTIWRFDLVVTRCPRSA